MSILRFLNEVFGLAAFLGMLYAWAAFGHALSL